MKKEAERSDELGMRLDTEIVDRRILKMTTEREMERSAELTRRVKGLEKSMAKLHSHHSNIRSRGAWMENRCRTKSQARR